MSKDHSFDIVSRVDLQEVVNAVDQTKKELAQRFDFKASPFSIEWNRTDKKLTVTAENENRLKAIYDVLQLRFTKRGVSLKALEYGDAEKSAAAGIRQIVTVKDTLDQDKIREIIKAVKQAKYKVQVFSQESQIRVQAPKIDHLQEVIAFVKTQDFGVDLQFINLR